MKRAIDVLLIDYFYEEERWHNDDDDGSSAPYNNTDADDVRRRARSLRQGVGIDGKIHDFSRFLSFAKYGNTLEYRRFDSFALTLLVGSYYLSFLKRRGFEIEVSGFANRATIAALGESFEPRFVMLSTTLMQEPQSIMQAVFYIRRSWPDAAIIIGGLSLVEYQKTRSAKMFKTILRAFDADAYVVTPNGEKPLLEILSRGSREGLARGGPIKSTYLLVDNGERVIDPAEGEDETVEFSENYIRWHDDVPPEHLYHTVHMRTARSCAFSCAFCNFPVNQGPLTLIDLNAFEKELEQLAACEGVRSIVFTDDTFNVPIQRFKEVCRILARFDFEWYSFFRAQYADDETAELMRASHCKAVFLGIESADDQILKNMNKVATVEKLRKGVRNLKAQGIHTHANFIIGFPGETERSARTFVEFLDDTEIDFFNAEPWFYVTSTPIHARREEFGLKGAEASWSHNTMDSTEATRLTEELVQLPKRSIYTQDLAANTFWTQTMLYANGFTKNEIQAVFRAYNSFSGRDTPSSVIRDSASFEQLRRILAHHELPRPAGFRIPEIKV